MTANKQRMPSFASVISLVSIVFYCAGFLRIELELNEQKKKINALENVAEIEMPTDGPNLVKTTTNAPGTFML